MRERRDLYGMAALGVFIIVISVGGLILVLLNA